MVLLQQAGRINEVGAPHRVKNVADRHTGRQQLGGIGSDGEFRFLSALYDHRGHAVEPIEARLQIIGCHRPELRLRHSVGGQAIAENGKAGKVEAVRLDDGRRRQLGANARQRGIYQLERGNHIHVPVEEQINFSGAATGNGADIF